MTDRDNTLEAGRPLGEGRERALDFLRGLYIILACMQHFAGIGNALGLAASPAACTIFWLLTPSGDQFFLALAAFNLARRDQPAFKSVYRKKVLFFSLLFVFFAFEGFVRAFDLPAALSWGPMLTWMVILALLASLYRFLGPLVIAGLFLAQIGFWLLPMPELNDYLESSINLALGLEGVRYESRLDLFVGSGCVGFLLGYFYYHFESWGAWRLTGVAALGALLMVPNVLIGPEYSINPFDLFATEYQVAESFPGILAIWGTIALFIYSAIVIDRAFLPLKLPVVNWCGEHSLLVFALHLTLFIRVILPLRIHFGNLWDAPLRNGVLNVAFYTAIVIGIAWLVRKTRVLSLIER